MSMKKMEDEITFFVYADEYYFSATELEKSMNPNKVATASYYLYGHALELLYKSFLHKKGVSLGTMKNELGHDLISALDCAREKGIGDYMDIDSNYSGIVSCINKYYSTKEFEYMRRTEKTFPHLFDVKDVVRKTRDSMHELLLEHLMKKCE